MNWIKGHWWFLLSVALGCTRAEPRSNTLSLNGSVSTMSVEPAVSSANSSAAEITPPQESWVEAVRLEDWALAASLLDKHVDCSAPRMRYVRAKVAMGQEQWSVALTLLDGLESALPQVATDIALQRAEAHWHGGQADLAAQYFAQLKTVRALTKASQAYFRASQVKLARSAIDRAIQMAGTSSREDGIEARLHRAMLAQTMGDKATAIADLRFVYQHARDPQVSAEAWKTLRQVDPNHRLTSSDRMQRAWSHANRGYSEPTRQEIEQAKAAPGGPPPRVQQLLAQAKAYYESRKDYRQAAQIYEQAAKLRGPHGAQALYLAAKAWSRAEDNNRALALYEQVIHQHTASSWAERASYDAPRLYRFQRRWPLAERGYRRYLQRYPRGSLSKEARYELALCLLLSGQPGQARPLFESLASGEKQAFEAASFRYLGAVAAFLEGNTSLAASVWRDTISSQPLSWFSLMAQARLASMGQPTPPIALPAPSVHELPPMVVNLPPTVQWLRDLGLVRDAEEAMRTQEEAFQRGYGDRGGEALCRAYGQLQTGGRLYRMGQRHAPQRLVQLAPTASNRWAWECLFPYPYGPITHRWETEHGIPSGLSHAIMRQESAFNPEAQSPVGAQGLMQLMPTTADRTAQRMGKPFDLRRLRSPGMNITLGMEYLSMLLRIFNGHVPLAVGAYNAGPMAVGRWLQGAEQTPLDIWVALVPYRETRHYIWRVMSNWLRYRYLLEGEASIPVLGLHLPGSIRIPDDAY